MPEAVTSDCSDQFPPKVSKVELVAFARNISS